MNSVCLYYLPTVKPFGIALTELAQIQDPNVMRQDRVKVIQLPILISRVLLVDYFGT